jgi:LacI family transcriptional regulator
MIAERKYTLKDIAKRANLSVAAVSQILNNKANDYSSEESKALVRRIARELNYKQAFKDKLTRGDSTNTIGLLIALPRLVREEHCSRIILEFTQLLNQKNYNIYWRFMSNSEQENMALTQDLIERGVGHFIFLGEPYGFPQIVHEIEEKKCTFLTYGAVTRNISRRNICSDSLAGSRSVFNYLQSLGIRNFGFLTNMSNDRFQAFKEVFPGAEITDHFIPLEETDWNDSFPLDLYRDIGYRKTHEFMQKFPETQAVFYHSDYYALGGARYLHEHGCKVGKDVLVFGFNNTYAVRSSIVPICSVEHDTMQIAKLIADHVTGTENIQISVPTRLVLR